MNENATPNVPTSSRAGESTGWQRGDWGWLGLLGLLGLFGLFGRRRYEREYYADAADEANAREARAYETPAPAGRP